VLDRDVADQLHHVHRLAHTGAAKQPDLAAFGERANQVDHLDAGLEQLLRRRELLELRRLAVDRHRFLCADGTGFIDRAPQHIHDAPERLGAHRHRDRGAAVEHLHPAAQPIRRTERNRAHHPVTQLLLHFQRQRRILCLQRQRIEYVRHLLARKLHVDHRTNALDDRSCWFTHILVPV
jgi:hypothetical protein